MSRMQNKIKHHCREFINKHRHHPHGKCHHSTKMFLAECLPGKIYVVCNNPDRKLIEMGLYNRAYVQIVRNDTSDTNIIVAVGESRYIIGKNIAETILVRELHL